MATKAHVFESLSRLLAVHENAAAAIRATIALLHSERLHVSSNGNGEGLPAIARAAVAIDTERREKIRQYQREWAAKKKAQATPPSRGGISRQKRENRIRSSEALAKFDPKDTRTAAELGIVNPANLIGPLVRRGYLKKKGGGYIRTAKPFHINPRDAKGSEP